MTKKTRKKTSESEIYMENIQNPTSESIMQQFAEDVEVLKEGKDNFKVLGYTMCMSYQDENNETRITFRLNGDSKMLLEDLELAFKAYFQNLEALKNRGKLQ